MSAGVVAPRWAKEGTSLAPVMIGILSLWPVAMLMSRNTLGAVPVAASIGAILVGAWSIGSEYTYRTLAWTLAQPESRAALWARKRGVAAIGTLLVLASAWAVLRHQTSPEILAPIRVEFVVCGLCALTIAPLLTMVGRSPLFGAVMTVALAVAFWSAGSMLAYMRDGPLQAASFSTDVWTTSLVWRTSLPACAIGLVLDWLMFRRLQAVDGGSILAWSPQPAARDRMALASTRVVVNRPWRALVGKELRLQQVVLVGVVAYGIAWIGVVFSLPKSTVVSLFDLFSLAYLVLVAALAGALAGADEKQLGTHQSQALMPVSSRAQFACKLGVAWAVTLLAGVFPVCLLVGAVIPADAHPIVGWNAGTFVIAFAVTLWTCYAGTLVSSSVRALATATVLLAILAPVVQSASFLAAELAIKQIRFSVWVTRTMMASRLHRYSEGAAGLAGACLVFGVVATLAARNHRWPEVSPVRAALQLLLIACSVVAAFWLFNAVLFL